MLRFLMPLGAVLILAPALVSGQRTSRPAILDGIWNSATATPLERPRELTDKPFFTPAEATQWERDFATRNEEPAPDAAAKRTGTGTYNTAYREFGTRTVKTLRTSIITEPADGRIPTLTPAAAEIKRRRLEGLKKFHQRAAFPSPHWSARSGRFRPFDADTLLYQFEIDNPTAFTQPWKGELTMTRSADQIYEYACHEGNYSLTNMLRGYRAAERPLGESRKR